jgi:hypothetical protein
MPVQLAAGAAAPPLRRFFRAAAASFPRPPFSSTEGIDMKRFRCAIWFLLLLGLAGCGNSVPNDPAPTTPGTKPNSEMKSPKVPPRNGPDRLLAPSAANEPHENVNFCLAPRLPAR